jgi:hypothetical protein
MPDVFANILLGYATLMTVGFGGILLGTATGPMRLVTFAVMLIMAAAPNSELGGPRL